MAAVLLLPIVGFCSERRPTRGSVLLAGVLIDPSAAFAWRWVEVLKHNNISTSITNAAIKKLVIRAGLGKGVIRANADQLQGQCGAGDGFPPVGSGAAVGLPGIGRGR